MTAATQPAADERSPDPAAADLLTLRVTRIQQVGADILGVTFAAAGGGDLPAFVPGSHLVVTAGERTNAYSLTSDGTNPTEYSISVLRVADGAGGSRWIHDQLSEGDLVQAHLPRSAFAPQARAGKHLLIAGGIGVTPIVSHLRAARRWHRNVQVLYAFRPENPAHLGDLSDLAGDAAEFFTQRADFLNRLDEVLLGQPIGTHLYVCGPAGFIDHVITAAAQAGWPDSRIHSERFGIDALDAGDPFAIRLTKSGKDIAVASGTSMLEALEHAGIAVANRCRQGVCGECRIPLAGGNPIHRDLYLTDEEKTVGDAIMPCVSRAPDGSTLEIPL